jgi:hypothetical protein
VTEHEVARFPAHVEHLRSLGACGDAVAFASRYDSLAAAWAACEDPRWLLWYAGRVSGPRGAEPRRRLTLCACECARLALPYVRAGEERPRIAIETAEAWARGGEGAPTLEQVRVAAAAADAADAYAAADAAYAAAAAAAARTLGLSECLAIVRRHYPEPPEPFRE